MFKECGGLFICLKCVDIMFGANSNIYDLKRLTNWLSFVMSTCEPVTFPLVSWARCGT